MPPGLLPAPRARARRERTGSLRRRPSGAAARRRESAAPSSGTVTATVPTTLPFASTRTVRRSDGRVGGGTPSVPGTATAPGTAAVRRFSACSSLSTSARWSRGSAASAAARCCAATASLRGLAQRRLERDAEMGGHAALLLLTDGVGQHQADARQRCDEQRDERDRGTATDPHLVGMAGHTRQGRRSGSHWPRGLDRGGRRRLRRRGSARVRRGHLDAHQEIEVVAGEGVSRAVGSLDRRAVAALVPLTPQPGVAEGGSGIAPRARIGGQDRADDRVTAHRRKRDDHGRRLRNHGPDEVRAGVAGTAGGCRSDLDADRRSDVVGGEGVRRTDCSDRGAVSRCRRSAARRR